jgi:16S rRNA (cytosine967-C5)-methyltransferase
MPVSFARKAAFQILRRVDSGNDFAVDLLQGAQGEKLKDVDRNLATQLVMGVLRWRGELDFQIERLSGKPLRYFDPEVLNILRMGIFQIQFLERIPKAAAVNEAVELAKVARKRSAAGLINAVLRKFERLAPEALDSGCRTLPAWLGERWTQNFGADGMKALAWASVQVPPTTLRVSTAGRREEIGRQLSEHGIESREGSFSPGALTVVSGNAANSQAVREGRAVIQDEGSQLVAELVAPHASERVLDLCAAPGIKLRQLAAAQGRGLLVACDLSARRLRTLTRLLPKNLELRPQLVRLDAACELPFRRELQKILVDAPCSGTGTLARNPEAKWRLKPEDLTRLANLQARILDRALEVLAPGGRLVYATCSLEPEENEGVVQSVLKNRPEIRILTQNELSKDFPHLSNLFDQHGYFRTRPDVHGMDGFFATVMTQN